MATLKIRITEEPPLEAKFRKHLRAGTEIEVVRVQEDRGPRFFETKYWVKTPAGECALLEREIEVIE